MSLGVMHISTAIQQLELTQKSRSPSAFSKPKDRRDIRLSQSSKTEGAGQFLCTALSARHSTALSRQKQALSDILTAQGPTTCRAIFLGGHTLRTKPTRDGTAELLMESATAKSNYRRRPFVLSGHLSRSDCGMQQMPQKYSELTHPPFDASPRESEIGRVLNNSLYGPDAWEANPWVVALTFTVHKCNIDRMTEARP